MPISVVDVFCGAGGLTHGFILEHVHVNAGIDIDPSCRFPYEYNNGSPFILKDVACLEGNELSGLYPHGDVKILAGCAPCQNYSAYTQRYKAKRGDWELLHAFGDLVVSATPDIVTMENVARLKKHRVYKEFTERLEVLGYHVNEHLVYCPEYGIPQTRSRLVLFASQYSPVAIIPPSHDLDSYVTVRQSIGDLEPIEAGAFLQCDPLHRSSGLSPTNLLRIQASRPGGTWRDWDYELVADCHRRQTGKTYPGVYGRMEWDKPSPTLTTQFHGFGNGRFGHPEQDRAISLREGAILQTFPIDYAFVAASDSIEFSTLGRLIGNAVPVTLGRVVARSIIKNVEAHYGPGT